MNLVDEATALLTSQNRNSQRDIEDLCRRQQMLMSEAEQSWYRFLPWFKKQCREFCNGVDAGFEPLLQKLLLNEDWTFPKWEEVFYVKKDHLEGRSLYSPPYYQPPIDFWSIQIHRHKNHSDKTISVLSKIKILTEPEKHTRDFLNRMYALYQKLPHGSEGLFDVEVTWEDLYEYIFDAMQIVYHSGGDFRLFFNLNWKTMQRIYHAPVVFKNKTYVFPARELEKNNLYFIKDTPFEVCIPKKIKVAFPLKSRLEHQWIVAGSGAGKTQLLQRMICDDIEHGRSVIVIDSQRDMIGKLIRLKHDMEVVYIDPEDIEHPPGIALFDIKFGSGAEAEARETQVIELYEYMFSVFGAELTARQGSLFTYGLRLMFAK
jgi:hypothetical protein